MKINTITLVRIHALVLIICSFIGLFGFYFQYHYFQITACIPATVGLALMIIALMPFRNQNITYALLFLVTFIFGIILTRMSIKFVPQDFQPLRKRIYFPVMALSSILTSIIMISRYRATKK